MKSLQETAKEMYEQAKGWDDLGNRCMGRPRDLYRLIARDVRNVADNLRELDSYFGVNDPEDDPEQFEKILTTTYDRAYAKEPMLTVKVCWTFTGEERLQWLQNIIDGNY